ncbi:cx9C motif-containing protein 4 [Crotalus adamanteus]|uniref:Cx9C motif-containing protein 4 n=1 Tax=Crotalus adamanteus TaxID=8729 RepID=A0AAW1AUS3_CROAD
MAAKDPCKKHACEIQKCLQANNYLESRCEAVFQEMRRLEDAPSPGGPSSLTCRLRSYRAIPQFILLHGRAAPTAQASSSSRRPRKPEDDKPACRKSRAPSTFVVKTMLLL